MKVKDLQLQLSTFDPEAEIAISYDYIYEFQVPDFEKIDNDWRSDKGQFLPKGSYVHIAY